MPFHAATFQNDKGKVSPDVKSAQDANRRMEDMIEKKLLSFNQQKSQFMVIGSEKARKKLLNQLEITPLMLAGKNMILATNLKYLGDQLAPSLATSVEMTVNKRTRIVSHSVYEIRTVIDDKRAEAVGGLSLAFTIWEMAIIPMLLFSSETWIGMKKKTTKELEKLQLKYI